jgi:hypothetical protein
VGHRRTGRGYLQVKEGKVTDKSYKKVYDSSNRGLSYQILNMVNTLMIEDSL